MACVGVLFHLPFAFALALALALGLGFALFLWVRVFFDFGHLGGRPSDPPGWRVRGFPRSPWPT